MKSKPEFKINGFRHKVPHRTVNEYDNLSCELLQPPVLCWRAFHTRNRRFYLPKCPVVTGDVWNINYSFFFSFVFSDLNNIYPYANYLFGGRFEISTFRFTLMRFFYKYRLKKNKNTRINGNSSKNQTLIRSVFFLTFKRNRFPAQSILKNTNSKPQNSNVSFPAMLRWWD